MEAFTLLNYWRSGGGGRSSGGGDFPAATTTIVTAVTPESDDENDDDGPFFDLEFTLPEEEGETKETHTVNSTTDSYLDRNDAVVYSSDEGNEDGEGGVGDQSLTLSPSDDLFFKGRLLPIEPSVFSGSEPDSKPQFPVSLLKSATKFRVFLLGFKKSKESSNPKVGLEGNASPKPQSTKQEQSSSNNNNNTNSSSSSSSKLFTVKFKVEEVPIVSMFTRENSKSSSSSGSSTIKLRKQAPFDTEDSASAGDTTNGSNAGGGGGGSEEKKFSKEVMQKYLNKMKPLYVRVSKQNNEKVKPCSSSTANTSTLLQGNVDEGVKVQRLGTSSGLQAAGLRVVRKHLGKSRSASSSAVASVAAATTNVVAGSRRRDDSLLLQQDGIQSAILHCKRSFNASRETEAAAVVLSRSVSDTSHDQMSLSKNHLMKMGDSD